MADAIKKTEVTLAELAAQLGGQLDGDGTCIIRGVETLEAAEADHVSFLANLRYQKHMAGTAAAAVIVTADYERPDDCKVGLIRCKDAYFAFRQAMVLLHGFRQHGFSGVDDRAEIDASARLGASVAIAPFATVTAGAEIGDGTVIYPGAYIGPNCRLGRDCVIYPNATLYDGTILHDRVTVHAGSSIGHDGFGYATHAGSDGVVRHEKIPQAGWVELEDDVEIGACCAIDRATMGRTIIGAGTKLSNLVAIGHGTQTGKGCLMVAHAGIAGSVMVGDYCVFAGQCGVVGHIKIGDGAKIGAKAGVTNDVPAGQEVLGSPARPLTETKRIAIATARLPEMKAQLRKLTRQVEQLRRQLDSGEAEKD